MQYMYMVRGGSAMLNIAILNNKGLFSGLIYV